MPSLWVCSLEERVLLGGRAAISLMNGTCCFIASWPSSSCPVLCVLCVTFTKHSRSYLCVGIIFFFFFKRLEFKHPERFILCNDGPTPPPPPTNTTQIMFRAVGLLWAGGRAGALEGGVGLRGLDAAGYKIDL